MKNFLFLFILISFIRCETAYSHEGAIHSYRVVDGDTIEAIIDIGWGSFIKDKIRMGGYNSPEIRKKNPKGHESKSKLKELLETHSPLKIEAKKRGKYGRWIGFLFNKKININNLMIEYEKRH